MASISELRDRFLSAMGNKSEAAKAATLSLEPTPTLADTYGAASLRASDYITISNDTSFTPWATSATITFSPAEQKEVVVPEQPEPRGCRADARGR